MNDVLDELLHRQAQQWTAAQPEPPSLDHAVQGAAAHRNHRTGIAVAATVVAIAAVAAIPVIDSLNHDSAHPAGGPVRAGNPGSSRPAPSTSTRRPSPATRTPWGGPADPVLRELTRRAHDAAVANEDPTATGEAVRTTYRDAERIVLDGSTSSNPPGRTPVWVIQLHGSFRCVDCSGPARGSTPTGTAVALIINARTYAGYDFTITKDPHDLTTLGKVIQLPK